MATAMPAASLLTLMQPRLAPTTTGRCLSLMLVGGLCCCQVLSRHALCCHLSFIPAAVLAGPWAG